MLGLKPVPPELREDLGELELAAGPGLPELVELSDVRGFVHCHSTWSDGNASIEKMVAAARALGGHFTTVTDHSRPAHYANGLDLDRHRHQWDEVPQVQRSSPNIRILHGSEAERLAH